MKKIILLGAILTAFAFMACKKTRTCSCKTTDTATTVTTPRGAVSASTTVHTSNSSNEMTYDHIKKSEMSRYAGCTNRTETSSNTNTTIVSVPTVSTISGFTFNTYTTYTADVVSTDVTAYDCSIK